MRTTLQKKTKQIKEFPANLKELKPQQPNEIGFMFPYYVY